MIEMQQPSLALHSHDVPGYKYRMSTTWKMPENARPHDIVYWILYARDQSPEMRLKNVIINCHGCPGYLCTGKQNGKYNGIGIGQTGLFKSLRNKDITTIWIIACNVACGTKGKAFCKSLAQESGCYVVAADKSQYVDVSFYLRFCPYGCVDDYEGTVYCWDPEGSIKRISQNGSGVPH